MKGLPNLISDVLVEGDAINGIARFENEVDLIMLSALPFHLGDLASLFAASARALALGGNLCFTADVHTGAHDNSRTDDGRFQDSAHGREILRREAVAQGMKEFVIHFTGQQTAPQFYCSFTKVSAAGAA